MCTLRPQLDSFEREVVEYVKPNHGTTTLGFIFQVRAPWVPGLQVWEHDHSLLLPFVLV